MAAGGEIGRDIDPPAARPISQIRRFTCRQNQMNENAI